MIPRIQASLQNALKRIGQSTITPSVTPTADPSHGDYATNVAFVLAKHLNTSPLEAAQRVVDELEKEEEAMFSKIEVAKPGFINFTLSNTALSTLLADPKKTFSERFKGKKIMIEFTDPNPFKEFHIGHLYSNTVGEALARLIEAQGAEVKRVNYQGDVGLHVAKALWGLLQQFKVQSATARGRSSFGRSWRTKFNMTQREFLDEIAKKSLQERAKFLGEAYALGATAYEEDESAKQEIVALNRKIYALTGSGEGEKDADILELYTKGRQWSLEYFETIYERLGTKFWRYYFESEAGPIGLDLVNEYLKKGIFIQSQGAVIFPGEQYGLHNRVFINSLGLPTYEAKELGLAPTKFNDYAYDQSIIVTGNEIDEYFRVLLKALSLIRPELAERTRHISHGMVRLPEGKMSSRTGNVLTGEWLMDEAVSRAKEKIAEVKKEGEGRISGSEQERVAEMVGIGAVKYALLRSSIGKDIEFSFDESISFEGNAGPYLQYTYVRTRSVLEKAGALPRPVLPADFSSDERQLMVHLVRFDDVKREAAERYSPSTICTYLFELAQLFNLFYSRHPILTESENVRELRLLLTQKVGEVIQEGLKLLGIPTPERM